MREDEIMAINASGNITLEDLAASIKKVGFVIPKANGITHFKTPVAPLVAEPVYTPNLNSIVGDLGKNVDVTTQLNIAYLDKDITDEVLSLLKEKYNNDPQNLSALLVGFAKTRLHYLMSLTFEELDKSDMAEELHTKYLQGAKFKTNQHFGTADKMANEGIADGFFTQNDVDGWKRNFAKDPSKLIQVMFADIQRTIDGLMEENYDTLLSKDKAEFLKRNYLQGYKQKYIQRFGIEYKEQKH